MTPVVGSQPTTVLSDAITASPGRHVGRTNALTFATVEDATEYAWNLYGRWTLLNSVRVVTVDTPEKEPIDLSDERVVIGREV